MPTFTFHDSEFADEFLADHKSRHHTAIFVPFGYKFMKERYGDALQPDVNDEVKFSEDQSRRLLSFVAVANAMINRDADNKVMKRLEELGAIPTPTLTWIRIKGPIQRTWRMYRPLELAFDHPEAVGLLRDTILNHGYTNTELLNEIFDAPMSLARGVL